MHVNCHLACFCTERSPSFWEALRKSARPDPSWDPAHRRIRLRKPQSQTSVSACARRSGQHIHSSVGDAPIVLQLNPFEAAAGSYSHAGEHRLSIEPMHYTAIASWLETEVGLPQYFETMATLLTIWDKQELQRIGITLLGHQTKIMGDIRRLRLQRAGRGGQKQGLVRCRRRSKAMGAGMGRVRATRCRCRTWSRSGRCRCRASSSSTMACAHRIS